MGKHKIVLILALACLLCTGLWGCGAQEPPEEEVPTQQVPGEEAEPFDWEPVALTTTAQGETCFVLSPQEFIQRYNSLFRAQWGEDMLPPLAQWMDYGTEEPSGAGGGHQYVSLMDESNYAEPFLSLWVTQNGKRVMETVTGVSQKNYEEGPMTLFQRKAQYSLQVFFPTLTEEDFLALYEQLFRGGQYGEAGQIPRPIRVFYQDGVACYATLQIGECDQIHVMAAGQEQLDQWRADGVEIVEGICPS